MMWPCTTEVMRVCSWGAAADCRAAAAVALIPEAHGGVGRALVLIAVQDAVAVAEVVGRPRNFVARGRGPIALRQLGPHGGPPAAGRRPRMRQRRCRRPAR